MQKPSRSAKLSTLSAAALAQVTGAGDFMAAPPGAVGPESPIKLPGYGGLGGAVGPESPLPPSFRK